MMTQAVKGNKKETSMKKMKWNKIFLILKFSGKLEKTNFEKKKILDKVEVFERK